MYILVEYWGMYWLRLENVVACLNGMSGSCSRCCLLHRCWTALTEMEMILDWDRGNHYVVAAAVVAICAEAIVAFGRDSQPRLLVQFLQWCCQWIRSSREGHCLNMPH